MTDNTTRLADIKSSLENWYNAALGLLTNNPESRVQRIPVGLEEWHKVQPRFYMLGRAPFFIYTPETVSALQGLDAYVDLEQAARNSIAIGPLFGSQIGTHFVTHEFEFWNFANAVLPRPENITNGSIRSFEDAYLDLCQQFSEVVTYKTLCLLQGVSFKETSFVLAPGETIEMLTDDEIKLALKFGLIPDYFGLSRSAFYLDDWSAFALKKRWTYPRRLGEPEVRETAEGMQNMASATDTVERLGQCLGLLNQQPVYVSGILTFQAEQSRPFPNGDGILYQTLAAPKLNSGVVFDATKCEELRRLWMLSQNNSSPQLKAFGLALRRLGYAVQRNRLEDRMLDICIAAEAFYLTDLGKPKDKGEMRYRLSLRAAVWSDDTMPDWTRLEIFQQIRAAYDVRSAVAHGGQPDAKDLKIKGKLIPLAEYASFVQCIENIVRAGLYKAFKQFTDESNNMSIDWDALVLPDSPAPSRDDRADQA